MEPNKDCDTSSNNVQEGRETVHYHDERRPTCGPPGPVKKQQRSPEEHGTGYEFEKEMSRRCWMSNEEMEQKKQEDRCKQREQLARDASYFKSTMQERQRIAELTRRLEESAASEGIVGPIELPTAWLTAKRSMFS